MSITKSGIVHIFTSNTQHMEVAKQMKRLIKVKQRIHKRKSQLQINFSNKGHTKHSITQKPSTTTNIDDEGYVNSKRLSKFQELTDHAQDLIVLQKRYKTNFNNGISQQQAFKRLEEQGENVLTKRDPTPEVLLFLKEMSDPFSLFLWLLTVLSCIYYGFTQDSNGICLVGILVIVLFSGAGIQYVYNKGTAKTIDSIKSILPLYCNVVREGVQKTIQVQKLVRGDIVLLSPGFKIPADLRIIECNGLRSDNSIYTGQTKLIHNSVEFNGEVNPFISKNMLFSGSINIQGTGKGLVINTGNNNLFSEIAQLLESQQTKPKFIQAQIQKFVIYVTLFACGIGIFTFLGGYITGFRLVIAVMIAIGVTVASVPGVLNLQCTVMFTLALRKLRQRNIICKDLYIIQNLGATSCLCTDKTGTLTKNQLTVSQLWMNNHIIKCSNKEDYGPNHFYQYDETDPLFKDIQRCAILTSIAKFQSSPSKRQIEGIYTRNDLSNQQKIQQQKALRSKWTINIEKLNYAQRPMIGNPIQIALTYFFQPLKDIRLFKQLNPYIRNKKNQKALKTFKSQDRYSMSINKQENGGTFIYCKGAPQNIWNMCKFFMLNGRLIEKTVIQHIFEEKLQYFADRGQTVIAFSKKQFVSSDDINQLTISPPNFDIQEQTFLGMISFQDPPKKGVPQTIEKIRVAGIKVVMITGDQEKIATKIAKMCNIITVPKTVNEIMKQQNIGFEQAFRKSQALVITGSDIDQINISEQFSTPAQKQRALMRLLDKRQVIFAKASPAHKLYIIKILQKMGHMVTVTGDGTNDSAALKISNCGICMGSGSDIAKDCADIIIADDDFNKILEGIQEGRKLFDNLKKAILYVMSSQIQEFMPFILLIFSKIPIPIFTLLIDAPIDFVPTIAYVYQEGQTDIMTRKPKDPAASLVNARLIGQASGWSGYSQFLCCLTCYYFCMIDFGFIPLELWQKNSMPQVLPLKTDSYNPTDPFLGNSNLRQITSCSQFESKATTSDFINSLYPWVDIRMSCVICKTNPDNSIEFLPIMEYGQCRVQQISIYTDRPVCYTSEATKYGQTSYMYGNVICQVFNLFMCKSSKQSAFSIRTNNKVMIAGLTLELLFALALSQFYPLIYLIGTRDNIYYHYGLPGLLFGLVQFTIDEIRKWLMRNVPRQNFGDPNRKYEDCKPNWFQRNTRW